MNMPSQIIFSEQKLKEAFEKLTTGSSEEKMLYEWILRAFGDLENNANCGIQLAKNLIPKIYIKTYDIENLWKYDLPKGWRLIYSVENTDITVVSIILEWFDHKNYERRFGYGN